MDINHIGNGFIKSESALKDSLSLLGLSLQRKLSNGVFINGTVKGRINSEKCVVINNCGSYFGTVKAKVLHVSGLMFGNIEADSLIVYCTGKVYCKNAKVKKVFIYNGGIYSINEEYLKIDNNLGNLNRLPFIMETADEKEHIKEPKMTPYKKEHISPLFIQDLDSKVMSIDNTTKKLPKTGFKQPEDKKSDTYSFVNSF